MGVNFSSQETYNTINSFTSMINSFSSSILNDASTECASVQTAIVIIGASTKDISCTQNTTMMNTNITQKVMNDLRCGLTQENLNKISVSFQNSLNTNINQWIKQNLNQNNGWLATGINIASQMGVNEDNLTSLLSNSIKEDIANVCKISVAIDQTQTYAFCGTYDNLDLDLSLSAKAIALGTCINSNIQSAVATNKTLLTIIQKTDEAVSQSNSGILSFIIWLVVGMVLVAIIGGVFSMFSGGGGSPPPYMEGGLEGEAGSAEELGML